MQKENFSRRDVMRTLFGTGGLGLISLATGIPSWILADPRRAMAQEAQTCIARNPQFLILSTSTFGDSIGNNAPGTYFSDQLAHPPQSGMAPTSLTLDGKAFVAAKPWADLPQKTLDQMCFFHHATLTGDHSHEPKVLALNNATQNRVQLPALLSAQLAPCLNTIQWQPIALGVKDAGETLKAGSVTQASLSPTALAKVFGQERSPLNNLQALRDTSLSAINAVFRAAGNGAQKDFIDQYVLSQQQVRMISQDYLAQLSSLTDNSIASQLRAALILFQMRITPVVSVHMAFGGDNHSDPDLEAEASQTVGSLAALGEFSTALDNAGMLDKVTFAALNVFGRPLGLSAAQGRVHHPVHNTMVMSGSNVAGGVIGGVVPHNRDFAASPIASSTGEADPNGDITRELSLGSVGKTLGAAVGLPSDFLNSAILSGKIIPSALK